MILAGDVGGTKTLIGLFEQEGGACTQSVSKRSQARILGPSKKSSNGFFEKSVARRCAVPASALLDQVSRVALRSPTSHGNWMSPGSQPNFRFLVSSC